MSIRIRIVTRFSTLTYQIPISNAYCNVFHCLSAVPRLSETVFLANYLPYARHHNPFLNSNHTQGQNIKKKKSPCKKHFWKIKIRNGFYQLAVQSNQIKQYTLIKDMIKTKEYTKC